MNNTNGTSPDNRRRDVRTPAQRKAEAERLQKKKLEEQRKQQEQKSAAEKAAKAEQERLRAARQQEIISGRKSSVKPSSNSSMTTVRNQGASAAIVNPNVDVKKTGSSPAGRNDRQLHEQRVKLSARYGKINELERQIEHQKLIREDLLYKQSKKPNPEKSKNLKIAAIALIAVLLIANIIAFAKINQNSIPQKSPELQNNSESHFGTENGSNAESGNSYLSKYDKKSVTTKDYINGTVALVNTEHMFNFDYTGVDIKDDELVTVAKEVKNKTFKAADYRVYLNSETVDMLNVMMADFYAVSGKNDVMVNSAHRTFEQQQSILDSKTAELGDNQQIAQTPGNSEHHTGYAFDFSIYPDGGVGARTFKNEGVYTWIYENCHRYGFVLRYPEGKTAITGIAPESWHFRYVGIPHASYMYNKGKTLEEYVTDIAIYTESIPLTINVSEDESYSVFYVPKSDGAVTEFNIPKNTEYKISGDNVGGFIVWYNNADVGMSDSNQTSHPQDTNDITSIET